MKFKITIDQIEEKIPEGDRYPKTETIYEQTVTSETDTFISKVVKVVNNIA